MLRWTPALLALLLTACGDDPERRPALGEAYVAPPRLALRKEIDLRSPVAATAKHGERVEIVQRRRRFYRVRTEKGAEGWTDQRMLLNAGEMAAVRRVEDLAAKLPSQGAATTLDLLNAHMEPYRQSPTIFQLKEGDRMEVLAYETVERVAPQRKPLLPPPPKPEPPPRKPKAEPKIPPPPKPPAPPPPGNWLELSRTPAPAAEAAPPKPPPPRDDWALVRSRDGEVGWVLASRLFMSIPDEVAQYAEGRRITSYFALGEVAAADGPKRHWLWTTIESRNQPHDFDSFRVFIYSVRRRRYETAYIERNRVGHFPVLVNGPRFSVCMEKDGSRVRRSYELQVNIVRFLGEAPCETALHDNLVAAAQPDSGKPDETRPQAPSVSWFDRMKRLFR